MNRKEALRFAVIAMSMSVRRWLEYTIHEWPSGVLYGADGATPEECNEILEATQELRRLDNSASCSSFASNVEEKTLRYRERLAHNKIHPTQKPCG